MTRWLTILLLFCCTLPLSAQGKKKGKNRPNPAMAVAGEKEDESRVVFAFDPGSHTRPISALGFNKDQSKLITVGWDYSIQIWSTKTGERLDIIRLPAYGRDNGFDSNRWNHAAISADGAYVAVGGGPKLLYEDQQLPTRLVIVDIVNRRIRKMLMPADPKSPVTCLSFSANGDRLAVGFGGVDNSIVILDDVIRMMKQPPETKRPSKPAVLVTELPNEPYNLALSRTGQKLVVEDRFTNVMSWNVTGNEIEQWKKLGEFKSAVINDALEWSPDETHFAWSWRKGQEYGFDLRSADCKSLKSWQFKELSPAGLNSARVATFRYLAADRLYFSAHAIIKGIGRGSVGMIVDPTTGKTARHFYEDSSGTYHPFGTASLDGTLAATTTERGMEAVIYSLADGKIVSRCGSRTPVPTIVGWASESKAPAIAWSDDATLKPWSAQQDVLKYAFDLSKLEPVSKVTQPDFDLRRMELKNWKLTWESVGFNYVDVQLKQADQKSAELFFATAMTLIPTANTPLFANSAHDKASGMGSFAFLRDAQGKTVAELLPIGTHVRDMVSSPDGRYLLMSTGTHRLSIYRTDGSRFPFLNYVQANGEWVAWMPEGYYAASPGGEKLIGWAENKGPNEFAVFHPAEKFAKHFRRPDVLKLAIEKGSLSEALAALNTETRDVEEILPPQCALKLLNQVGGRVQVEASAIAAAADKPVVAVRLLLDGRPVAMTPKSGDTKGERAVSTWELEIPAGNHELKILARGEESSAVSEPLVLKGPKSAGQQPVLHRLCVGVDKYALPALNLTTAAKDATDVFAALEKHCVGIENRFGTARGTLLTDKQATRQEVGKAILDIRKAAKPGDLVVFLFAGHGIKQQDEYYLLTHEADPSESLKGKSLSGTDLRQALKDIECPVLLMMDSCHSAGGVKSFRPATDDLTRSLTDDTAGVTVLAAAMAHEVASSTQENGHFTAAFLKALELNKGTPYDPYENLLYTHHIYSVVFSEVRKATNGKQNPFLNMPWTVPPLAVRDVPRE